MPDVIKIYVDGGAKGRVAWVIKMPFKESRNFTFFPELKTGNEAEFYAVLRALFDVPGSSIVEIHSDSQLVVNGLSPEGWYIKAENLQKIIQKINDVIYKKKLFVSYSWSPNNPAGKLIQKVVRDEKIRRKRMRNGQLSKIL